MVKQKTIKLVDVYFGTLPLWMPAFFISCDNNPDIEWILFTDASPPELLPENVKFIEMNAPSFNRLCKSKLGLKASITSSFPYKLCDFKPVYGVLFEDYLKDCDFWGFCDIDVIWGDFRHFFNESILSSYDILTTRLRSIAGHCCLFRNTVEINNLYRGIPKILDMLQDSQTHHSVDEDHFTGYLRSLVYPSAFKRLLRRWGLDKQKIPRIYWDRPNLTTKGLHQRELKETNGAFWWREGKTYDTKNNEIMYIHFHKIKQTMKAIDFSYNDPVTEFAVSQEGIFSKR